MKKQPRKGWRTHYEVWVQAEGRDRDDPEYAARCRDCDGIKWLCSMAGDRKEAWSRCLEHEISHHGVNA